MGCRYEEANTGLTKYGIIHRNGGVIMSVYTCARAWSIFILLLTVDARTGIWAKSVTYELSKHIFSLTFDLALD